MEPSPPNWIKVNIIGLTIGTPGTSSYGGIFVLGEVLLKGCFSFSSGVGFDFEVERQAFFIIIEVALIKLFGGKFGWKVTQFILLF